ncbi:50S ribosomal protein L17 [Candidatus Saccharibacteria bacterium]|nr:50S ribosomal protein L17 [Candidatus Saccharibacteria bacterium]
MHRHSYKGRKFGRKTDQRRALMRGLMCALIENQSITTTLARAKEMRRGTEKLVTLAKKGGLANRRLIISRLGNIDTTNFLVDVVAPQIKRDSGYLRIERAGFRKGDHAELGTISFVDEIDPDFKPDTKQIKKEAK